MKERQLLAQMLTYASVIILFQASRMASVFEVAPSTIGIFGLAGVSIGGYLWWISAER